MDEIIEYALPEYLNCDYHGEYSWRAYYSDEEAIEMMDKQGYLDCPICLAEIVGIEGI